MADAEAKEAPVVVEEPETSEDGEQDNEEQQNGTPYNHSVVVSTPGEADTHRQPSMDIGRVEEPESPREPAGLMLPEQVMETGRITFLYTPRVEVEVVKGMQDVQRFHIILEPARQQHVIVEEEEGTPGSGSKAAAAADAAAGSRQAGDQGSSSSSGQVRLVLVPKKRLPDTKRHERFFAFVDAVSAEVTEITSGLTGSEYETKTRGTRHQGPARVVGEGSYVIAKGGRRGATHLAYKLEVPASPGEAQAAFKIRKEGSHVISVKNPGHRPAGAPSAGPEPEYSEPERKRFKGRAWIDVDPPTLLDNKGTELLLVGAADRPVDELGDAGALLEEIYYSDSEGGAAAAAAANGSSKQAAAERLEEHLEPPGDKGAAAGGAPPIPVEPAVEGKLV